MTSGDFDWLAKLFKETQPEVLALGIQELHPNLLPKFLQDVQQARHWRRFSMHFLRRKETQRKPIGSLLRRGMLWKVSCDCRCSNSMSCIIVFVGMSHFILVTFLVCAEDTFSVLLWEGTQWRLAEKYVQFARPEKISLRLSVVAIQNKSPHFPQTCRSGKMCMVKNCRPFTNLWRFASGVTLERVSLEPKSNEAEKP